MRSPDSFGLPHLTVRRLTRALTGSAARGVAAFLLAVGIACTAAQAQGYRSIVVFGDSLSDTGNVADLVQASYGIRIPGPAGNYTDGRFTDGFDTAPAARQYTGVWIEQLAALLPNQPEVKASLDGGLDYAYGFALTSNDTSVLALGPSNTLAVTIDDIGLQIATYLAGHPRVDRSTLYVVWGGANDVLQATTPQAVIDAAARQTENIQRLVRAGATRILIVNLPPLGLTPRLNGSPVTAIPATEASILFNSTLAAGVDFLSFFDSEQRLRLYQLDVFTVLSKVVAAPGSYGFLDATHKSRGLLPVNPDNFLFWDDLHPTTHGHNVLALEALKLVSPSQCESRALLGQQPSCASVP